MKPRTQYTMLASALQRLEERYQNHLAAQSRPELLPSDKEALKESCIQRFEVAFDTLWKHLKKHLEEAYGLIDIANGPKPIFREAAASKLIDNVEQWFTYNQKRIDTSHDYSGEKAKEAFAIIPHFISDAAALYTKMSGDTWSR